MWDIYSIGDGAFLFQILQSVAALLNDDDFENLVKIGMMAGVGIAVFQGLLSGGRSIPLGRVMIAALLYGILFESNHDVSITDVYTSDVYTVDNVPTGIAAAATAVSSIGYRTTEFFEQAFSTPEMTTQGYGFSLETIKRVRLNSMTLFHLGPANSPDGVSKFYESWFNYINECTLPGVIKRHVNLNDIVNGDKLAEQLKYAGKVERPLLELDPGYMDYEDCEEAHDQLLQFTLNAFLPAFKGQVLTRVLDVATADEAEDKISAALTGLGLDTPADDFILTSVLVPIYYAAASAHMEGDYKFSYATAIDDAIRQRNAQWMANESVFAEYLRPLLTFLEGFIFLCTPFLLLLVPIGALGLRAVTGMLLLLIWIQLWMPLLAGVNLFVHMALAGDLGELVASGQSLSSMGGLFMADDDVQKYIAVGGLMASSIPVLSLLLITGFTVTANFFASSLGRQDTFTEAQAAPLTYGAFPLTTIEPFVHRAAASGIAATSGYPERSYTQRFSAESAVQEAEAARQAATATFGERLSKALGTTSGTDVRGVSSRGMQEVFNSRTSEAYRTFVGQNRDLIEQVAAQHGIASEEAGRVAFDAGLRGALGLGRSGRISEASAGLKGGAGSDYAETHRDTNSREERVAEAFREQFGTDRNFASEFSALVARDVASRYEQVGFRNTTLQDNRELQQAASDLVEKSRTHDELQRRGRSLSQDFTVGERQAVSNIIEHGAKDNLMEHIAIHNLETAVMRYMSVPAHREELGQLYGENKDAQYVAAALRVLSEPQSLHPSEFAVPQGERDTAVADVMSRAFGYRIVAPAGDLSATSASGTPEVGATRSRVEEQWQGLGKGVVGAADARIGAGGAATAASASDAVRADYEQNAGQIAEKADLGKATASEQRQGMESRFTELGDDKNLGTTTFGIAKEAGQLIESTQDSLSREVDALGDKISRGIDEASETIENATKNVKKFFNVD